MGAFQYVSYQCDITILKLWCYFVGINQKVIAVLFQCLFIKKLDLHISDL